MSDLITVTYSLVLIENGPLEEGEVRDSDTLFVHRMRTVSTQVALQVSTLFETINGSVYNIGVDQVGLGAVGLLAFCTPANRYPHYKPDVHAGLGLDLWHALINNGWTKGRGI
jgi:hypothetical protein